MVPYTSKVKRKFLSKYFKNEDHIPKSRVSFLFNDSKKLKEEDKIKMTKIYFLENFLLGNNSQQILIWNTSN